MKMIRKIGAPPALLALVLLGLPARAPAQATFQLGDATAAPGATDVVLPFSILLEPGTPPVIAWSFPIEYDPDVFPARSSRCPGAGQCCRRDSLILQRCCR